jgi:CheY-like chemotaxis protein
MSKIVLIVDDNEPTRKLLGGILEGAGYQTLQAGDGETARAMAKENKIACALIDQYMEPMDGFMLARNFKADDYTFPMTMITANESNDLLMQAREHGFVSIMMKPVEPARLLQIVERMSR